MTLNIGARILVGFLVLSAAMGALCAYQLGSMRSLRNRSADIVESNLQAARLQGAIFSSQKNMRIHTERAIALHFLEHSGLSNESASAAQQEWELARRETEKLIDALVVMGNARAEAAEKSGVKDNWRAIAREASQTSAKLSDIGVVVERMFTTLNSGDVSALPSQMEVLDRQRALFSGQIDRLVARSTEMDQAARQGINTTFESVLRVFMFAIGAAALTALATIRILHRSISPPLNALVAFVEKVGQGDLTKRVEVRGRDEIGRLATQINGMADSLADATRQTLAAVTNVGSATAQLQASVAQQAASTSEQNSAVQEISTTLNEVAQSGAQIAERAKEVAAASETTSSASQSGVDAVSATYLTIGAIGEQAAAVAQNVVELTEKTRSIGDIITTVNDIAERSNLLALNAAIEASAAGEQGQSFAVVADEMKNLAGQAKEATAQVQSILGEIQEGINASVMQTEEAVKRTETGKRQSEQMKATIETLVENIETSIQTFEQIIAATNQQQIGIEQVSQAIDDIRNSSSDVAEGTRSLEGATSNLNALSQQLQQSVNRYVVS